LLTVLYSQWTPGRQAGQRV